MPDPQQFRWVSLRSTHPRGLMAAITDTASTGNAAVAPVADPDDSTLYTVCMGI